jgi:hypothetical protein
MLPLETRLFLRLDPMTEVLVLLRSKDDSLYPLSLEFPALP